MKSPGRRADDRLALRLLELERRVDAAKDAEAAKALWTEYYVALDLWLRVRAPKAAQPPLTQSMLKRTLRADSSLIRNRTRRWSAPVADRWCRGASVRVVLVPSSVVAAIVMLMALQIGGFEVYQAPRELRRALACQVTIRSSVLFIHHFADWERLGALQAFCPVLEISPDTGFLGGAGRPLQ